MIDTFLRSMTLGLAIMSKIGRSFINFVLLGSLMLIIAQDCYGAETACNNETFIGKEAKVLMSKDFLPCDDSENVCFVISSKLNTLCSFSSANYSFNFSSSGKVCQKFSQKALYPCKFQSHGIRCRVDKLSQCHSANLAECLLSINVYVTVGNLSFKQYIVKMYQVPRYVAHSHLRVNKLYLEVQSSTEMKVVWFRPVCKLLSYSYYLAIRIAGSKETRPTDAPTTFDSKEDVMYKRKIHHLKPFTKYTICVMSLADYSYNWISGACKTNQTLPATPSKAPEIYSHRVIPVSSSKWKCLIKWKSVDKEYWNGIIEKIKINLFKKEHPTYKQSIVVPVNKSSHIISPLDAGKEYLVQLEFCNSAGCAQSKKLFIASSRKGARDVNIPWPLIGIGCGILFFIVIIIIAAVLLYRKRWLRTPSLQHLVPNDQIPDPNDIHPVQDGSNHIYDEINERPYDQLYPVPSSSGNIPVSNFVEEQTPQNGSEENFAGAMPSASARAFRFIDNTTCNFNKDQCINRESAYRSLAECGRHIGECTCHAGGASGNTRIQETWKSSLISDHETLLNHIDPLESSEDDYSRAESYELDSNRSIQSSSIESEPLMLSQTP